MEKDFILASSSSRRLALLAQAGITPKKVVSPEIDEMRERKETPLTYVKRMAVAKAEKVVALCPNENVLAADTIVACGNRILIKTSYEQDARHNIGLLSGRRHRVITAVCLIDKNGKRSLKYATTAVKFKLLSEQEINDYFTTDDWKDKAGSYAIQGIAETFVKGIIGQYSNVVGLPLYETVNLLKQLP